jgi:2-hydroxychromene-2-carboxylate isomerase
MKSVEFFFDLSSPYSYLASTQIEALAARAGAPFGVRWRPFVLGAVFKATGNVMPAACPAKAKYMLDDLARYARHYGVPFRMSSHFPLSAMKAHRLIVAIDEHDPRRAAEMAQGLFSAVWVDDQNIADEAVLKEALRPFHISSEELQKADDQTVKDRLRAQTDEAVRRGAFGAPSFFVGDELFWGDDRLPFVEEALRRQAPSP